MYGARGSKHYKRPKKDDVIDPKYLHRKNIENVAKLLEKYAKTKNSERKRGPSGIGKEQSALTEFSIHSEKCGQSSARQQLSSSKSCRSLVLSARHESTRSLLTNDLTRSKSDMNLAERPSVWYFVWFFEVLAHVVELE